MLTSWRWLNRVPFLLALASLVFIFWSAIEAFTYPHDGITDLDSISGKIGDLDSIGEVYNGLKKGDIILEVNGKPLQEAYPFYKDKKVGDIVTLKIVRDGITEDKVIKLYQPIGKVLITPISITIVALFFWLTGVGILAFKPGDQVSNLFYLFCQAIAILLMSGLISSLGPDWVSGLFYFSLWLIGPLALHFHTVFPQQATLIRRRSILIYLYVFAILGSLPYLIFGITFIRSIGYGEILLTIGFIFLALNLLTVFILLVHAYSHTLLPGVRGKIRIVVLGGGIFFVSVATMTILPGAIFKKPFIDYRIALLFLITIPLTYGYAIVRHRLIEIDRHVSRGATFLIVVTLLGGLLAVFYALRQYFPQALPLSDPLVETLLVLALASIFPYIYQRVQRIVNRAFYGGWYDYRTAVAEITQGLEQITDLSQLGKTITSRLVKTLQLVDACVFLKDLEGSFSVIEVAPPSKPGEATRLSFSALPKNSLTYLLNIGAIGREALREALAEVRLSPEERQLLDSEQIYLWVPIISHGQVLGLLALGSKLGGDVFSGEDMDILRIVSRQMGPLIENIHLVTRLRQYAAELEQRVEERTAELHAEKERVEAVLSSVGDGVFVTDLEGNIVAVNDAFEAQSGYSEAEVIGKSLFFLLNGQQGTEKALEIRKAMQEAQNWSGELIAERKGGRLYDIDLTISPFRDQTGAILGFVGSQRDITQYKELERLKDQFILEVSHELRTPVTNMGLFAELLERGKPDKKQDYLNILKSEINQLMTMIEDILDLSRLEVGKYKRSAFTSVDLNLVADQVVSAHLPLAEESGLELRFSPDEKIPLILGDQNQIARVITNLLSNAIRYTPSGYVQVRTGFEDGFVWLEVEDTGIGIEESDYPHLFERFYRGQKVRQSKILGSGLGLAIVKEIMELHDGRITWHSEVGKGTTFRVWFPA